MALLFKVPGPRGDAWISLFKQYAPDVDVRLWPDVGDASEVHYFASWESPEDLHDLFPNLKVIFATSAGVDQFDLRRVPEQVSVVRMLDPGIAQGIVEYACFAVLAMHRQIPMYLQQQRDRRWEDHALTAARHRRVGVMGLGNLGVAVLQGLRSFGFELSGWARSQKHIDGVQCFAGKDQMQPFLNQCDILICLLPLTDDTRGILNSETLGALPKGASLINLGRGGHLVEDDLLGALESGHLSHAVVDVLNDEPPATDHPFWRHPNIWLTPHIGAMTSPESAFEVLLANIRRYQNGEEMQGQIARSQGY